MIEPNKLKPFRHLCMTIGAIPTSYKESMTYYEMLEWLCRYLEETVIPTVNNNAQAVEELQELFTILRDYVDHYFDNLDLQEEIDTKLDEMAESGQLTDIIAQYLQLAGILAYDTVADLKEADNLVNGSLVKTYGYHAYNDNGGALYKVRNIVNTDVPNDMDIIALADVNLVAELIEKDKINVKQLGAYGDNIHDDYNIINYAVANYDNIIIPEGTYIINTSIQLTKDNINIHGYNAILDSTSCANEMFDFEVCNNINITGLTLLSTNEGSILCNDCSNVNIKDCNVTLNYKQDKNASAINIQRISGSTLTDRENFTISNCKITTSFMGVLFQGKVNRLLKNIRVENCEFIGNNLNIANAGELLKIDYYTENTIITNNVFKNSKSSAITCEEHSDKILINDNILTGDTSSVNGIRTYYGQSQTSSNYLDIINNIIDNFEIGIINEYYDNVKINDNTIINCRTNSLSLWNSTVKMVCNNIIKGAGCLLRASASFINNYIETTTTFALQMINTSKCNIIGNTFKNGYLNCRATTDLLVKDNTFIDSVSDTLGIITVYANDSTQRNNIKIMNNILNGSNATYGVYVANVYNNVYLKDNIVNNTTNKLYLASSLLNVINLDFRNYVSSASSIPSGTSKIGDIVYNTNPTAGGYVGWIYTSSGWKGYGLIAS